MERIYVVEDDENIRNLIKIALEGFGYRVDVFEAAEPALESIEAAAPDMAVFDLMLPGIDGLEAIARIRAMDRIKSIPVMILTAKDKELDKVVGLDKGADDYMTKPFGVLELAARVRSLLRRNGRRSNKNTPKELYGQLSVNPKTREVAYADEAIELTFKEYELLNYLIENEDRVVARDELLDRIWGYTYDGETRTLDIHIRTLRQKLGEVGQEHIRTVRGVGYRFIKNVL